MIYVMYAPSIHNLDPSVIVLIKTDLVWKQGTTNLPSRKELLECLEMLSPQESRMTSFQLSPSSSLWTLKGLVMGMCWLAPLRIIDFLFGEETMHWTETERKKFPIFSRMKQLILADWGIWSDPKQMLSFHCFRALKKAKRQRKAESGGG